MLIQLIIAKFPFHVRYVVLDIGKRFNVQQISFEPQRHSYNNNVNNISYKFCFYRNPISDIGIHKKYHCAQWLAPQ